MYEGKYRVVGRWELRWSDLDQGPGKAFLRKGCLSEVLEESAQVRWEAESTWQSREDLHRLSGRKECPAEGEGPGLPELVTVLRLLFFIWGAMERHWSEKAKWHSQIYVLEKLLWLQHGVWIWETEMDVGRCAVVQVRGGDNMY